MNALNTLASFLSAGISLNKHHKKILRCLLLVIFNICTHKTVLKHVTHDRSAQPTHHVPYVLGCGGGKHVPFNMSICYFCCLGSTSNT